MLEAYANAFKVSEKELTKKSLGQLKLWALLGLPATPLFIAAFFGKFSSATTLVLGLLTFVSGIFLMLTMISKFTNRFWARDKYLDEWELQRKHHSMAVAFQVIDYVAVGIIFLAALLASTKGGEITINFEHIATAAFCFVLVSVYIPLLFLLWTVKPVDDLIDG